MVGWGVKDGKIAGSSVETRRREGADIWGFWMKKNRGRISLAEASCWSQASGWFSCLSGGKKKKIVWRSALSRVTRLPINVAAFPPPPLGQIQN